MSDIVKDRLSGLGGSDAPVCAGLSPYKSPLQLFYEKTGQLEPETAENEAMEWGTRLEPIVAEAYCDTTKRKVRQQPRRGHPKYPWLLGNIDRQIIGEARGVGILEVKTTNTFSAKDWEHGPPDAAMLQLQHYLAIYGYTWGSIAVLIGGQRFKYFDVERDDELIDYLLAIELKFWVQVQKREPPDASWTAENIGILKKLYPLSTGKTIALDGPQAQVALDKFLDGKRAIEIGENMKAEGEGWIKAQMADADAATVPGATITWRSTKASQKFDLDLFKQEQASLYAKYLKDVPGHRVFRVTPGKDLQR